MISRIKCFLSGHTFGRAEFVLSGGRQTHHDAARCARCDIKIVVFSGTRSEWCGRHGLDNQLIQHKTKAPL